MDGSAASVRTLQCPNCGGTLVVRGLRQTESVVCTSCHSIVDLTGESLRILSTFAAKVTDEPLIPLGTRGTLDGDPYEVIGYARRAITVDDVDYEWSEYLLFNPYKGFRWLTEYNGHWNDTKTTTNVPADAGGSRVDYLGRSFRHFQTAEARVTYVLGEFYWRVEVGETARVSDYVSPPLMLSKEETKDETTWSIGEYVEAQDLWRAFGLQTPPPARVGVYANQPSPYGGQSARVWRVYGALVVAAVLLQSFFVVFSQNQLVFEKTFDFLQERKGTAEVTPVFQLGGPTSNVAIRTTTNVDNNWIYLSMALISMDDGHAYDFGREIGYYHGVEGGESWSEGGTSDEAVLPAVPPGQYYLRLEAESPAPVVHYVVRVYRDVPLFRFLLIALGLLSIYPVLVWLRGRSFETRRWAESDQAG
jgi:hypothetical protein